MTRIAKRASAGFDALRPRVAVLRIESTPEGAEIRIDWRDLPVRGTTPIELAVPAGSHTVYASHEGYEERSATAEASVGSSAAVQLALDPTPIDVQVIAPSVGRLTLDGEAIEPGRHVPVAPGPHVVRLEVPNAPPIERRFEVAAGAEPLALELSAPATATETRVAMTVDAPAEVFVDNVRTAEGEQVDLPVQPGPHVLRLSAPGRTPLTHRITLREGERASLDVHLGQRADSTGLDIARVLLASLTGAGLAVWAGLSVRALDLSNQWNSDVQQHNMGQDPSRAMLIAEGHAVEDAALMADIALGITAGLAVTTLILLLVSPGSDEASSVQVGATPMRNGGMVTAQLEWGR